MKMNNEKDNNEENEILEEEIKKGIENEVNTKRQKLFIKYGSNVLYRKNIFKWFWFSFSFIW